MIALFDDFVKSWYNLCMLNDQDIKKLLEVFATKNDLEEAVANLASKEDINSLLSAIDAFAKKAETDKAELAAIKSAVNRHEAWIKARP